MNPPYESLIHNHTKKEKIKNMTSNRDLKTYIISSTLIVLTSFVFLSFLRFGVVQGHFRKNKKTLLLITFAITGPAALLIRLIILQFFEYFSGVADESKLDYYCRLWYPLHVFTYRIVMWQVDLFLWNKQRFLYTQPYFCRLKNGFVRWASKSLLLFIFLEGAVSCTLYFTARFKFGYDGCKDVDRNTVLFKIRYLLPTVSKVLVQIVLAVLFCYPLIVHARDSNNKNCDKVVLPKIGNQNVVPRVIKLTKMAFVNAAICVLTELTFITLVHFYLFKNLHSIIIFRNFTLLLDVSSVMLSYEKSTNILLALCHPHSFCCRRSKRRLSRVVSFTALQRSRRDENIFVT